MKRAILTAFAAVAVLIPLTATAANAAGPSPATVLQQRIEHQLELLPGGRQTGPNQISWDQQGVVMSFAMPGQTLGADTCPYNYACLYGDGDYNDGPDVQPWQINFFYCRVYDLGSWGVRNQASSWVNNQSLHTWATGHQYRDEAHTEWGYIQLFGASAYHANPLIYPNDRTDVFIPC